jgi:hypothetical protein
MLLLETIPGPVLFSLDFLILELALKQPLKNMQQPSNPLNVRSIQRRADIYTAL